MAQDVDGENVRKMGMYDSPDGLGCPWDGTMLDGGGILGNGVDGTMLERGDILCC